MTQGPPSETREALRDPRGHSHSSRSKHGQVLSGNLDFETALRIWEILASDGGSDPENDLQAVDVAVIIDAWISATKEQMHGGHLALQDKQAMSACMNLVVSDIGVDGFGQVDACEWLFQVLVRFSSPAIGWSITQLSTLMRMAGDHKFESFDAVRNVLQAAEDKQGGPLAFAEAVSMYCKFIWKDLADEGLLVQGIIELLKRRGEDSSTRYGVEIDDMAQATAEHFANEVVSTLNIDPNRRISASGFMVCCLGRPRREVLLHQYDLTRGGAKVMSFQHLEGVWHTGLVIYGREYFFNGGLVFKDPGETSFGTPTKVCPLGHSHRRKEELHAWVVEELKPIFTRDNYDIIENNCNHFTDQISLWLCGNSLPDEVRLQGDQIKRNPVLAQMLKPFFRAVEGCCFSNSTSASTSKNTVGLLTWAKPEGVVRESSTEAGTALNDMSPVRRLFNQGYQRKQPQIVRVSL